ncbi:MAG: cytochrome c oxidase accessory protein CcoG [Natronospirillum sp.]
MSEKIDVKDITPTDNSAVQQYSMYVAPDKIYIRRIKGLFRNLRFFGVLFLFTLYFGTVWLEVGGQQAVWFDLGSRQFHIFSVTFWPQDFFLLSFALIICAFGLFFITVFAGRVWCGYTCPQSVWTWIFVFIEEKTEGKRNARIKLDAQRWSAQKILRKAAKHTGWILVAVATAVTFVGYFVPIRELVSELLTFSTSGWVIFWVCFFTLATYGNAGWMREQVCIYMCPYARFQAAMFDQDTLIVSYDAARGEPRGSRKKSADPRAEGLGDCIDCDLCVQVCPVGIDIRDGLQYECISCAACVDACDSVMEQMNYPKGLVRYTTEHNLSGQKTRILRPRLLGYGLVLLAMFVLMAVFLTSRIPAQLDVIRDRGALHRVTPYGMVENSYTLRLMNMDQQARIFRLEVSGVDGLRLISPAEINVAAGESVNIPIRVETDPERLDRPSVDIFFYAIALDDSGIRVEKESRFFGPSSFR